MQYTYPRLLASCQNYCIDNSSQYLTEFPNIIQLTEMQIIKDLEISGFDLVQTGNLTSGINSLVKPNNFIAIRSIYIVVSGNNKVLQLRSKSYLDDYWRNANNTGEPVYFAEATNYTWQITPTPAQAYGYQVNYIGRPTPMSATNPTTWLGDKLGELMLYGTLGFSLAYFREDVANAQGITKQWEQEYQVGIAQARKELVSLMSATDQSLTPIIIPGA